MITMTLISDGEEHIHHVSTNVFHNISGQLSASFAEKLPSRHKRGELGTIVGLYKHKYNPKWEEDQLAQYKRYKVVDMQVLGDQVTTTITMYQ